MDSTTLKEAFTLFQTGADYGDKHSINNLGIFYVNGQGVAQDYVKARELFEKAVAMDFASAMVSLGRLYANGNGVAQDYAKARDWWEKAAAKDDTDAMVYLGALYENVSGRGAGLRQGARVV
jgi:uncharacterized protein